MCNRISRISEWIGPLGRRPTVKTFLVFALGFIVFSQQAILKAQDPAQGLKSDPSTPALSAPPAAHPAAPLPVEYSLNPGDVLDVYIYDVPELSHSYTVSPLGTVTVPLLPTPIQAAGLTPDQFARAMEDAFRQSGRLRRPEIAVSVKQSLASSVAVEGAVKNPLVISAMGRTRLVDVLTQCGGLAEDAGTNVTISRGPLAMRDLPLEGGLATPTLTIEVKRVMDVNDVASTIAVWPGDRVFVARAGVFYVLGEVKTPGGYTIKNGRDELTVLQALALAGDVTGVAKKSKALIIRKDLTAPLGREEIKLDLQSILNGKTPDPKLQANDILFVPGSGSKKALKTIEGAPALIVGQAGAAALIIH